MDSMSLKAITLGSGNLQRLRLAAEGIVHEVEAKHKWRKLDESKKALV